MSEPVHKQNTSEVSIIPFEKCKYIAVVTILFLTKTELLTYLNFPSTGIFYITFQLSEIPLAFDNKHSQLL